MFNLQHMQTPSMCTIHLPGLAVAKCLSTTLGTVLHLSPKHPGSIEPEKQILIKVDMPPWSGMWGTSCALKAPQFRLHYLC